MLRDRVQDGMYFTDGFSSPELFTPTSYLGKGKQPMQENRLRGRVQEGMYITSFHINSSPLQG